MNIADLDEFVAAAKRRHDEFDRQRELARLSAYFPPPPPVEVHQMELPSTPFRKPLEEDPLPLPTPEVAAPVRLPGYILYPAPTYDRVSGRVLSVPLYPSSDLPITLRVLNITTGALYDTFTLNGSYSYGGTLNAGGQDGLSAELTFGDWALFVTGYNYQTNSLVGNDYDNSPAFLVRDTFPGTVFVNGLPVIRTTDNSGLYEGSGLTLFYDADPLSNAGTYKWTVAGSLNGQKLGSQNTPLGNYSGGIIVSG